jgi:hypothetical protein
MSSPNWMGTGWYCVQCGEYSGKECEHPTCCMCYLNGATGECELTRVDDDDHDGGMCAGRFHFKRSSGDGDFVFT